MENKAKSIEMIDIDLLVENPKNNNQHPPEQIERLAKIIKAQGFRNPLTVSNRSGFVIAGHGRIEAARLLGIKELPVIKQDFDNEAQEYLHMTADNEIARWATLDLDKLNLEIKDLDIDIELLGLSKFEALDPLEVEFPPLGDGSDPDIQQMTFTVSNEQRDIIDEAMSRAKKELDCSDEINQNSNGNILAAICRNFNHVG